jgi:cytochrome c2
MASAEPSGSSSPAGDGKPTTRLAGNPERGRTLVEKFECSRCHEGTGLAPASFEKHCFQCHQDINNDQFDKHFKAPKDKLAKWKKNVGIYLNAPNFEGAAARYRAEYIQSFLLEPYKVRPHMVSSMPRLAVTPQQAADIASYLTRNAAKAAKNEAVGDPAAGRAVLESKACGTCHVFSGVADLMLKPNLAAADQKGKDAIELAPDLRFVRDRMSFTNVVAWLRDPTAVKPGTLMPNMKLTEKEAKDAAAYISATALAPIVYKPVPKRLPPLERKVSFDEVDQKVLGRTCRHCHTNPDIARGDGGPGMTGGFGFIPRKLNLSSYEGVSAGLLDEKGERMSVFTPAKDGTPRIVASLLARQKEEAGLVDPELRGMPLGLPALSAEQIQIMESWVAQGRPQ